VYTPEALRHLVEAVGPGRVMLGTDYPFDMGVTDPVARLDAAGLPTDHRAAIAARTAAALFTIGDA
jgi:aminocarboxymuconate-semialdehyde decarboxylase